MPSDALSGFEASIYGCIQGLTEFLPVSSSGHLALAHQLGLGHIADELMRPFSVCLHVATLLAVLIAFRKEIILALKQLDGISMRNACLSIVPAVVLGFCCAKYMHVLEGSMLLLGVSFLITALLLIIADRYMFLQRAQRDTDQFVAQPAQQNSVLRSLSLRQALWVGCGQALALLPGVSRSGSSLCAGILSGVPAERAFAYSFLVGVPLIAGAALHEYLLAEEFAPMIAAIGWPILLWSMLCSLVSGVLAIMLLRLVIKKRCLSAFGIYCAVLAGMCLVFVIIG